MDQLSFDLDLPPPAPERPAAPPVAAGTVPKSRPAPPQRSAPPPKPRPFNYTDALGEVVRDLIATLEELRHVDQDRIVLSFRRARQSSEHGVYATCHALRFENGEREMRLDGKLWRWPDLVIDGRERLYILSFMLPRFHEEIDYAEKLATIIHELYHISPKFNGDIRRFPGKNFAHGSSREAYHAAMRKLAARYLATSPLAESHQFLKTPFEELVRHPGGLVGRTIRRPQPVRVRR